MEFPILCQQKLWNHYIHVFWSYPLFQIAKQSFFGDNQSEEADSVQLVHVYVNAI